MKINPKSDLVNLQITALSVIVKKNCLNWNKTNALEKNLSDQKWRSKKTEKEPTETRAKTDPE